MIKQFECTPECRMNTKNSKRYALIAYLEKIFTSIRIDGAEEMSKLR